MPVFDQFEVESASTYSGSYIDNAIYGEFPIIGTNSAVSYITTNGYTQLGVSDPQTKRRRIVSKATQEENGISASLATMWMPGFQYFGYISGSFLGRPNRFQSFFSNETWYDSYVPNPIDIFLRNQGKLLGFVSDAFSAGTINETSGANYNINPFKSLADKPNVDIIFSWVDKYGIDPALGADLDLTWSAAQPYQSKYKGISKLEVFSTVLPTTYNIDTILGYPTPSPVSQSNTIGFAYCSNLIPPYGTSIFLGAMHVPTKPFPEPGSIRAGTIHPFTLYNAFFGIGDGTSDGTIKSGPGGPIYFTDSSNYFVFVVPRGYKYGIRSVAPEPMKIVYRAGRYGQFRDMLESSPNTAKLITATENPYTGLTIARTVSYPLEVQFASGTLIYSQSRDYLTATNPTYNPYDSGIYDIYYRSGQPFFDRPSED